ncbi:nucleoside 2-deoxyribosyltransferase [candidate division KSB1 bacterium]|nr:nucleoside 2-deoxyribosyltransferase [candidate division KSB1 bacterium]
MNFQPDFNRVRTALFGGQPDRVPLLELAIAEKIMENFLGKRITGIADRIEFFQKAGYDYIKVSPRLEMNPGKIRPKEGERVSASNENINERSWHASGQGIITSLADFEKFRFPKPEEVDYSDYENVQKLLPDNMKIIGQYGDIFTWTWDFMGFETFSFALIDNPELVERLFHKIGSIVLNLFETIVTFDNIGAIFYSDDIAINTGLFVSPQVYRDYLFPWMKKIGDVCKQHDIPFIFHTDGNIWDVLDDLKACGVNALQPIEPLAMDIVELKMKRGQDFCLVGNVDVDLLARGSKQQIEDEVKRLLKNVAPHGGYCLGSGNTVPEYVPFENYMAMIETAHRFSKYPIEI